MTVDPENIENVIGNAALAFSRRLAVEDQVANGQLTDGVGYGGIVLQQSVARIQLDVGSPLEREHTYPVQHTFEKPFRPGESLLCQRRRHRHDPFRKAVTRHPDEYALPPGPARAHFQSR